jgi:hypothetical protein
MMGRADGELDYSGFVDNEAARGARAEVRES